MGGEAGAEGFAAGDDGQYVLGQGGGENGAKQSGGEGGERGRFEDHGVARRERGRELRRRELEGKVPRHDRGDGSEGPPADLAVHGPAIGDPPGSGGQVCEVAQAGRRTGDLRVRLGHGLALFPGEQPGEVVAGRLHGVGRHAQRGGAGGGVGAPAVPGPVGPVDHGVQLVRLLVGGLVEGLPGGRVDDGETRGPASGDAVGLRGRHASGQFTAGTPAACSRACQSISARKAATRCG